MIGRTGVSTSPCADRASSTWYLADGTTTADASLTLVLYNPFPDDAVVDVSLTTVERTLQPPSLQGAVVPGHSVRIVDLGQQAQREEVVSTAVKGRGSRWWPGASSRPTTRPATASRPAWPPRSRPRPGGSPTATRATAAASASWCSTRATLDASVELSFLPAGGGRRSSASPTSSCRPSSFLVVDVNGEAAVPPGPHSTAHQRRWRSDPGGGRAGPHPPARRPSGDDGAARVAADGARLVCDRRRRSAAGPGRS